ncbi:MarR family transcriptional regulator [Angustibacter aerolatus]|uniref:MarR family transcriptional regulator n=1 Tax=Angustibacter aerolatus TaxID=1162965 RepID=A0ABQ6JNM6_9ACTN|nr:MarR family transcriptional regulator [Angustibacter aerolatus]GMA88944.1 MarR family transcriptional regulator [Angustibacter aerolatus]
MHNSVARHRDDEAAPDLLALERQVCFALAVASRTVLTLYRPLLEPMGLTHPQYLVMLALWGRDEQSVSDLGARLHLDSGTLSPLLKRLEILGHVERRRATEDERRLVVRLTPTGRRLRQQAERIPRPSSRGSASRWPTSNRLHEALGQVIAAATRPPDVEPSEAHQV